MATHKIIAGIIMAVYTLFIENNFLIILGMRLCYGCFSLWTSHTIMYDDNREKDFCSVFCVL